MIFSPASPSEELKLCLVGQVDSAKTHSLRPGTAHLEPRPTSSLREDVTGRKGVVRSEEGHLGRLVEWTPRNPVGDPWRPVFYHLV